MLDLFCGRWGWSKAFAARGWECLGIDLTEPPEIPSGCVYRYSDVLTMNLGSIRAWEDIFGSFDFICASPPCEEFAVFGMAHFHPNPKYPAMGIRLFNHTRELCEESGLPYIMENVRPAQKFVGDAKMMCGPFALWGSGVPPLVPGGITKGFGAWDRKNGTEPWKVGEGDKGNG